MFGWATITLGIGPHSSCSSGLALAKLTIDLTDYRLGPIEANFSVIAVPTTGHSSDAVGLRVE